MWKIDPFAYCPHGQDGSEQCGVGSVHHVEIPDAFTKIVPAGEDGNAEAYNVFDIRKCRVPFAVAVVGMEHINAENIAVTVLRASLYDYSPDTGLLRTDAKNASYQVSYVSVTVSDAHPLTLSTSMRLCFYRESRRGVIKPTMPGMTNV